MSIPAIIQSPWFNLIALIAGGLITWLASRHFYIKASNELQREASELRKEAQLVRKLLNAMYGAQLNPDAELAPTLDQDGNTVGTTVGVVGSTSPKPKQRWVGVVGKPHPLPPSNH